MSKFYTDVTERGGKIYLRSIDDGIRSKQVIEMQPELYIKTNDASRKDAMSMHDEPLEKVIFSDKKEMRGFIENYKDVDGFSIYGMDRLEYQFITRNFPGKLNFNANHIRGAIVDIEVFSGDIDANGNCIDGPFPKPETAEYPINLITIYTTHDKTYHVFGLESFKGHRLGTYIHDSDHPRIGKLNIDYRGFESESALLNNFCDFWAESDIDYWSGWYIEGFDNPYLTNRIQKVCGESAKKKLSPWRIIIQGAIKNSWGGEDVVYDYMGCAMLDYKALFMKHGFMNPDDYKLQTVGEMILGEGKVDYKDEGNLNTLYVRNYQKAVEYNCVDVKLVVDIDNKMQLLGLTFTLAYLTKSNYNDTLATVKPWSALAYSMLYEKGVQPRLKSLYPGNTQFAGGFVRVITPGRRRWVLSFDLNSLYPHLIQQYNLGAETIIEPEDLPDEVRNMVYFSMDDLVNKRVDLSILKKYNICMTANRQFFRRDRMSIFNEKTREIYTNRSIVKKNMLKMKQKKVDLEAQFKDRVNEIAAEIDEFNRLIKGEDNLQHSLKILMNSLFGALGNKYFKEYFDIRVAEGITLSGQLSILWITRKVDEYFNTIFKFPKGPVVHKVHHVTVPDPETILHVMSGQNFAFYQDTDSIYVDASPLVSKLFTEEEQQNDKERIINFLDKLCQEKIEPYITKSYEELADYVNAYENRMFMKREVIAPTAIWTAKKRYTMEVADSEGVRYWPKMDHKIMGLDAVKASYPRFCRNWLEEAYLMALQDREADLHNFVNEKRKEFKALPIEKIATPTGVNNLEKYFDPQTIYVKGAPMQVKASLIHNHLIEKYNISAVPMIKSGDKILHVGLKTPNPAGIEVIAFQGKMPPAFKLEKYVDYDKNFTKNFIDPLMNLIGVLGWSHERQASVLDWFE